MRFPFTSTFSKGKCNTTMRCEWSCQSIFVLFTTKNTTSNISNFYMEPICRSNSLYRKWHHGLNPEPLDGAGCDLQNKRSDVEWYVLILKFWNRIKLSARRTIILKATEITCTKDDKFRRQCAGLWKCVALLCSKLEPVSGQKRYIGQHSLCYRLWK